MIGPNQHIQLNATKDAKNSHIIRWGKKLVTRWCEHALVELKFHSGSIQAHKWGVISIIFHRIRTI